MDRLYVPAALAPFARAEAQVIGEELERIGRAQKLTYDAIVAEAQTETNPLHKHFEWRDDKAGHAFRKLQAGKLVRSIDVVIQTGNGQRRTQSFLSVVLQPPVSPSPAGRSVSSNPVQQVASTGNAAADVRPERPPQHFITVQAMQADPPTHQEVLAQAIHELRAWKDKYSTLGLNELSSIYSIVETLCK